MSETHRLHLVKFDGPATFRSQGGDNPIHDYVIVQVDRDRFNALGKPGYIDVSIAPVTDTEAGRDA